MSLKGTLFLVDDDVSIVFVLEKFFKDKGYRVVVGRSVQEAQNLVKAHQGDALIMDVMMPDGNGLELAQKLRQTHPNLPIIIISAQNTMMTAMKAAEIGALEYHPKPFDLTELEHSVEKAIQLGRVKTEGATPQVLTQEQGLMIGRSEVMQHFYKSLAQFAQTDMPVLIQGETGTGKELAARAVHDHSPRRDKPFIALNMGAIPKDLIESALFGHVKGAFTGAVVAAPGCFSEADGGTLFLDEIGDMPLEAQTKLLRVLQEGDYTPIGGAQSQKVNVRIIAATHRELSGMVSDKLFREDLYYRLNVLPVDLPPLRHRLDDLPELVQFFCLKYFDQYGQKREFQAEAMELLQQYDWPGNIRELENFVYRSCVIANQRVVSSAQITSLLSVFLEKTRHLDDASSAIGGIDGKIPPKRQEKGVSALVRGQLLDYFSAHGRALPPIGLYDRFIKEVEKPLIEISLMATDCNQIQAAKLLGLNRNTLRKKITDLKIDLKELKRLKAFDYDNE